jgi:hypothetical protein
MSIDPGTSTPRPNGSAVYYDDHRITVTSSYVATPEARYPVAELQEVIRCLSYTHPGRSIALITGGIEIALAIPFAAASGSAMMLCVGFVAAMGVAIGVLVDARRNPRWMELRADYRGGEVALFSTRDKAEFEAVRRALIRAVEDNRGTWC